jgi:hypothetical protein
MLERLLVAVLVVGLGGFLVYDIALRLGWPVADARNLLLLTAMASTSVCLDREAP